LCSRAEKSPAESVGRVKEKLTEGDGAKLTHYCVVRNDIPFGVKAAMLVHAAGESFQEPPIRGSPVYAVALAAKGEAELHRLERKLIRADVAHQAIREPDPPFDGALMAIGIRPANRDQLRKFVKKYPLIK
jgi:nucleotide-binding universal stress UspA family protein